MSVSAERNIRRFDRRSIFIIIKNVNENIVSTVMRSHETAIMLGLSLQKDTRLVSWGHFSLLSTLEADNAAKTDILQPNISAQLSWRKSFAPMLTTCRKNMVNGKNDSSHPTKV